MFNSSELSHHKLQYHVASTCITQHTSNCNGIHTNELTIVQSRVDYTSSNSQTKANLSKSSEHSRRHSSNSETD